MGSEDQFAEWMSARAEGFYEDLIRFQNDPTRREILMLNWLHLAFKAGQLSKNPLQNNGLDTE